MDTEKLRNLLEAVELKSFSKAADKHAYTPSAFSHIADMFEQELGIKILNRNNMGVELNENGKKLLEYFNNILEAEKKLEQKVDTLRNKITIKIGTYSSISKYILPQLIKEYKKINPSVSISVDVADTFSEYGKSDLIVSENHLSSDWKFTPIFDDDFVAVFSGDSEVKNKYNKEELYSNTYICSNDRKTISYYEIDKFNDIVRVNSSDDSSIINLVREGIGMAFLSKLTVKDETNIKTAEVLPKLKRTIGVSIRKAEDNKNVKELYGFLLEKLNQRA